MINIHLKNIKWNTRSKVVINDYEASCLRYTFQPAELNTLFSFVMLRSFAWAVGVSFRLHSVLVDENSVEDFDSLCEHLGIIIYDEDMIQNMIRFNQQQCICEPGCECQRCLAS